MRNQEKTQLKLETDAEKLRRRNRELTILNAIAEELNRSVDLDQALRSGLAQVAELLDLHTGWIWLLEEESADSYLAASQNLPPALANNPHLMEGSCYCLDTYRAGDLDGAANVNVVTCSRLRGLVDGTDGLRYHASIPLYAHGRELGVLNVASTDWRQLTPDDLRLLYTIGDLLSISIERARLYAHSEQLGALQERNRLAREIHDTLAQGLAAITLHLDTAEAQMESGGNPKIARQSVSQALALARANLDEARRSVLDLRAATLEGRRLADALEALTDEVRGTAKIEVAFHVTGRSYPLPLRIETGLYRIAQEAIANVVQHADAHEVALELVVTPEQVQLTISDDGHGFDPQNIPAGRYGLVGLNERAKLLGGNLRLESGMGMGTRVEVIVPMKP